MFFRLKRYFHYLVLSHFPVWHSKCLYRERFGRPLDLMAPKTLNEKLLWLKLNQYNKSALVSNCADKYTVREYVKRKGCGDILNELYGVWERPEEIDWDALPQRFVLKCNHASGFNIICGNKDELDKKRSVKLLKKWVRRDFWRYYSELQYREIPRRILCEKYIGEGQAPTDYKIYCFHGVPRYILACCEREKGKPRFYFFDQEWKFCPITKDGKKVPIDFTLPRPEGLEKMLDYAQRLSEPFPYVRVDLYDVEGKILFGELTFTPSAGLDVDRLPETDVMFGKLLHLPFEENK